MATPNENERAVAVKSVTRLRPALLIAVLFGVVNVSLKFLLRRFGPREFRAATAMKQNRIMLYLFSCVNAVVSCAPFVREIPIYVREGRIIQDPYKTVDPRTGGLPAGGDTDAEKVRKKWTSVAVHTITGYLLHDLVMILPDAKKNASAVVHHIVTLVIGVAALLGIDATYPHVPVFFFCEASTLLLNVSWFLRELPETSTWVLSACGIRAVVGILTGNAGITDKAVLELVRDRLAPLAFAATFTVVRIINFPLAFWNVWNAPVTVSDSSRSPRRSNSLRVMMGDVGAGAIAAVTVLQFYWFALILKKIVFNAT